MDRREFITNGARAGVGLTAIVALPSVAYSAQQAQAAPNKTRQFLDRLLTQPTIFYRDGRLEVSTQPQGSDYQYLVRLNASMRDGGAELTPNQPFALQIIPNYPQYIRNNERARYYVDDNSDGIVDRVTQSERGIRDLNEKQVFVDREPQDTKDGVQAEFARGIDALLQEIDRQVVDIAIPRRRPQ